jgi:hypothetical protein
MVLTSSAIGLGGAGGIGALELQEELQAYRHRGIPANNYTQKEGSE